MVDVKKSSEHRNTKPNPGYLSIIKKCAKSPEKIGDFQISTRKSGCFLSFLGKKLKDILGMGGGWMGWWF